MAEATDTESVPGDTREQSAAGRTEAVPAPATEDERAASTLPDGPGQDLDPGTDGPDGPDADQDGERPRWGEPGHPVFSAIGGFFAGMLFITALPGGFAGLLRLAFPYETAERLFPLVTIWLVLPIALLAGGRTRRFGLFMVLGMVLTALVVLGVASLALYFLVKMDG